MIRVPNPQRLQRARRVIEAARMEPGLYGHTRHGHALLCYAEDLLAAVEGLRAVVLTQRQALARLEQVTRTARKVLAGS